MQGLSYLFVGSFFSSPFGLPLKRLLVVAFTQIFQQEISVRMEQMRRLTILQETKYASLGRDVPQEMRQQLAEMHDLEKEVLSLTFR